MTLSTSSDSLWYKDAVIYELHVRAFSDSNRDGIGDFRGLTQRLDYLADLGVTAIWLLPFYPSPLRDDGYDIADYYDVHPDYGSLKDFQLFLDEAHKRGLRVITELVINHTSDQHEWFRKSRRAEVGTYWRDFYVWSDDPNRYRDARIIFKDFESANWTWDPMARQYFWHRFYSHQPDLNFDNPEVRAAIFKVVDFWFGMGVDGMRLDAVPYLYEREGTTCENLPETHRFLKELRAHVDSKFETRMLLAEANQWPEDSVAYFGSGDECQMNFHFPLMPRLFMALKMEDRYSVTDIMNQTPEIPSNCAWATFLRNHDELTLEMVTDEERDYMYKVYAHDPRARINLGIRRRLGPLLGNDRRQIELLNGLLFSLPGTPVIYYGDEIGMGDNIYLGDRNGVRTPFQWSPDRNAGFSAADPQSLYLPVIIAPEYHYEAINVENQQNNPHSLLWWMKNLVNYRKSHPALSRGTLEFLNPENPKVLAFLRRHEGQSLLIIANLSRRAQYVELDLSEFSGQVPVEFVGGVQFPSIGSLPYLLTLGPYGFYWFELTDRDSLDSARWLLMDRPPLLLPSTPMEALKSPEILTRLESDLVRYLPRMRWFGSKSRRISRCRISDIIFVPYDVIQGQTNGRGALIVVETEFTEGSHEHYLVSVAYAEGERADRIIEDRPEMVICRYRDPADPGRSGIYHEAVLDAEFGRALLKTAMEEGEIEGKTGLVRGIRYRVLKPPGESDGETEIDIPIPQLASLDQSNTSLVFGRQYFMKLFRRLDEGENPELEMGRHFLRKGTLDHVAPLQGALSWEDRHRTVRTLIVVQQAIEYHQDAWSLFSDHLALYLEEALARTWHGDAPAGAGGNYFELIEREAPGAFLEVASYAAGLSQILGERTGQMHRILADSAQDPAFSPEMFTPFYQRSLYQSLRNTMERSFSLIRRRMGDLGQESRTLAERVLEEEAAIHNFFMGIRGRLFDLKRIRTHGDYHLGQVVFTGKDFVILDFEGEPARSLSERRIKRSVLKDVAGMMRSFEYVVHRVTREQMHREEDRERAHAWIDAWRRWIPAEFLKGYLSSVRGVELLPAALSDAQYLTQVYVLEKALYEIHYELDLRPEWVTVPLQGVIDVMRGIRGGMALDAS